MNHNSPTRRGFLKYLATTPLVASAGQTLGLVASPLGDPSQLGTTLYLDHSLEQWISQLTTTQSGHWQGWQGVYAVGCFGNAAIKPLLTATHHAEKKHLPKLFTALSEIGAAAMPALLQLFKHRSAEVRAAACLTLRAMEYDRPVSAQESEAYAHVLSIIQDASLAELKSAFCLLGEACGDHNRHKYDDAVFVALIRLVEDRDPGVRSAAIGALGCAGGTEAQQSIANTAIIYALSDQCDGVRKEAAQTLLLAQEFQGLGCLSEHQRQRLTKALEDPCPEVRRDITQVLNAPSQLASGYKPVVQRNPICGVQSTAADSEDPEIESGQQEADEEDSGETTPAFIPEGPLPALPPVHTLLQQLTDTRAKVRAAAAMAIGERLDLTEAGLRGLCQLLEDDDMGVRLAAAKHCAHGTPADLT